MKKITVISIILLFSLKLFARGDHSELKNFPVESISEEEKAGLVLMAEEEKLARDVYAELFDTWKLRIFSNISGSEQQHMDSVKALMERYSVDNPVKNDKRGVFADKNLSRLYKELTAQGKKSLTDALTVGAKIEDLDIHDLDKLLVKTDNQDISFVYGNLKKGSENHIRAFTKQLERQGSVYIPEFISQNQFDRIISGNSRGKSGSAGNRQSKNGNSGKSKRQNRI